MTEQSQKLKFKKDKPTALVAGGAGFIGSYLAEALVVQGYNVICVDNLEHGSKENIERLLQKPNFALWEEDVSNPGFTLPSTIELSHVFHLASVEEYLSANRESLATLLVNSYGTKNLLETALAKKAKFVFISSHEVFHVALTQASLYAYFKSGKNPVRTSFAEAKRFAESLIAEYLKKHNLDVVITRIKDPYGPRMSLSSGSPLANLIEQAVKAEKIQILGDGLDYLNPTFVTDIVFGILKAAIYGEKGAIYNFINPEKFTVRSTAEILKKITGKEIEYKKTDDFDLPDRPVALETVEEKLKWRPKIRLEDGLKQTFSYYKNQILNPKEKSAAIPLAPQVRLRKVSTPRQKVYLRLGVVSFLVAFAWTILTPLGLVVLSVYKGELGLEATTKALKENKLETAKENSHKAAKHFREAQNYFGSFGWLTYVPGLKNTYEKAQNYFFALETLSFASEQTAQALISLGHSANKGLDEATNQNSLNEARVAIREARSRVEVVKSLDIELEKYPIPFMGGAKKTLNNTTPIESLIEKAEVATLAPDL